MSRKSSSSDTETVTLAHGAILDGKYVGPGEQVTVSADSANTLRGSGYAVTDGGDDAASAGT